MMLSLVSFAASLAAGIKAGSPHTTPLRVTHFRFKTFTMSRCLAQKVEIGSRSLLLSVVEVYNLRNYLYVWLGLQTGTDIAVCGT